MITIWSSQPSTKVLQKLQAVLKPKEIPVYVTGDFSVPAGTKVILALGTQPLKRLQEEKIVAKNRTVTSLRTQFLNRGGVPLLASYSPDISEVDYRYYTDLLTDVGLAVRYWHTGSTQPQMGTYKYVPDLSNVIASITATYGVTGVPVEVMTDTETVGLDPYRLPSADHPGAYIVTLQTTDRLAFAEAIPFYSREHEESSLKDPVLREQIEWLLNSPMVSHRGANFKYDLNWLWVRGKFTCSNFRFDTTLVGSLLDENRSNGLDVHVKIYAPRGAGYSDNFDRHVDKSRMDLAMQKDPGGFLNYACGDVDFGLEVAQAQKAELLSNKSLTAFYVNILHPAARAFEQIEQGGVCVDVGAFKELKADLEVEQLRLVKEAGKILGGRLLAKHYDPSKIGGVNLTKASLLKEFMFSPAGLNLRPQMFCDKDDKHGEKVPSTALEHLRMFSDVPGAKEFVQLIAEYGSVTKTYSTYAIGFMEHLRSDGRFHPTYFLFVGNKDEGEGGTNTGRLSATDPAFQVVPKHTKWAARIRRCFPAPPGYLISERDFSQGELRVVACVANETSMIEAYRAGRDLHALTGSDYLNLTYEQMMSLRESDPEKYDLARQAAKPANFGLLYGQGVDGFQLFSANNYGVHMTTKEAEERRNLFFRRYPRLVKYHEEYKAFARKHGFVPSPLGRVRHLPLMQSPNPAVRSKEERRAVNAPIQGCLSDMLLWTFALEHAQGLAKIAPAFGAVHDAAYNYIPEDSADKILGQMIAIQENLPFEKVGWTPQLPFPADAKLGPTMADLKKWSH